MIEKKITELNGSLLEFQLALDRSVEAPGISTDAFVAMRVGAEQWLIDLAYLAETSVPPAVSRTGRTPAWVLGIGSLRGQVYTLIDMQRVFLDKPTVAIQNSWATPLHARLNTSLALIWPQMMGLVSRSALKEISFDSTQSSPWVRRCWKDEQENVWQEFDVEAFVGSAFVNLDSQVATE